MALNEMFDVLPGDVAWGHGMAQDADGLELHYVRQGEGRSISSCISVCKLVIIEERK